MTNQPPPPPTAGPAAPTAAPPIQFDRADFTTPAAQDCAACKCPVIGAYYTANNKIICAPCRDAYLASTTGGSRAARLGRATLFGLGAGLAGAILWFAVRKLLSMQIGLLAILVGYMVGMAVRKGSRGRGGVGYQLLAVFLTYSAVACQWAPDIFTELHDAYVAKHHAAPSAATRPTTMAAAVLPTDAKADDDTTVADNGPNTFKTSATASSHSSPAKVVVAVIILAVLFVAITYAAPILMGMHSIIGLFIIAIGLWEAWKLNTRRTLTFTGPHAIAPAPAATIRT